MRLWHYKLIPVLPNKMLVSQWRECIAIKRQWEKGTLKHPLVRYVMEHHKKSFYAYVSLLCDELINRDIKYNPEFFVEICDFCHINIYNVYSLNLKPYPEHNNRYLLQCYYNLEEKYDRGIISFDEFQKILKVMEEM